MRFVALVMQRPHPAVYRRPMAQCSSIAAPFAVQHGCDFPSPATGVWVNPMTSERWPAPRHRKPTDAGHRFVRNRKGQVPALGQDFPRADDAFRQDDSRLFLKLPQEVHKKCRSEYTKWPGHPRSS